MNSTTSLPNHGLCGHLAKFMLSSGFGPGKGKASPCLSDTMEGTPKLVKNFKPPACKGMLEMDVLSSRPELD